MIDPSSVLSLFHYEPEANDITQEASVLADTGCRQGGKG